MNQPTLSILLIEDDEVDRLHVGRLLQRGEGSYQLTTANCFADAQVLLDTHAFDVLLIDLGLPDAEPFEPVRYARQLSCRAAIVVLSGNPDQYFYVNAVKAGADDYICKSDLNPMLLYCRIEQARQRVEQKLKIQSLLDIVEQQNVDLAKNTIDLERKNQRLQQLCESSEVFVNHVSHEFRTPLCVIKQYANLMAEGGFGPMLADQIRTLEVIEDRVDGLSNLVDDMLDISRHDAGLLSARRTSCQVYEFIDSELDGLKQRASVRDIVIDFHQDTELPDVFCDKEKSGRILTNLVTNAIKFSPAGSTIEIRARLVGGGKDVAVDVKDHGPGISKDAIERLFSRFQQTASSRLSNDKGFGLGLSIAQELAELNLGKLSIQNNESAGSVFTFTMPIDDPLAVFERHLDFVKRNHADNPTKLCRIDVKVPESSTLDQISEVHAILDFVLRCHDLLLQTSRNIWQVTLVSDYEGADKFIQRVRSELAEASRNCPASQIPEVQFCVDEVSTTHEFSSPEPDPTKRVVAVRVDQGTAALRLLSRGETINWLSDQQHSFFDGDRLCPS